MKKAEMMFIPLPAIGHIVAAVETAKLLVERDDRVSTSVLLINPALHSNTTKYIESLATSTLPNRMRVIDLPTLEPNSRNDNWLTYSIEGQKPHIKAYVTKIKTQSELSPDSPRLAGFVFDMLCTGLKDMANEFGVPWYVFSASSAAFFGCMLHLLYLHDEQKVELSEFKNSDVELEIPSLVNRIPARLLPSMVLDKESSTTFLDPARMWKEATGILMNTFIELESHVVNSFSNDRRIPPVYPVGPIVRSEGKGHDKGLDQREDYMAIKQWLDDQPPSSVVFLCFGSWGSFDVNQIKEIAHALERGGYRFLWSLRKQQPQGNVEQSTNYESFQEILSEKFLNRTVDTRKVVGWVPQVDILAHPSVGGFVPHCGWNSTLESIWFGVPIDTWPVYAEQQLNAFQIVIELGFGVEIKMDYKNSYNMDDVEIVRAEEIEKGIRCLMNLDKEKRENLKEMSEKSRKALMNGGSSYASLDRWIREIVNNIP